VVVGEIMTDQSEFLGERRLFTEYLPNGLSFFFACLSADIGRSKEKEKTPKSKSKTPAMQHMPALRKMFCLLKLKFQPLHKTNILNAGRPTSRLSPHRFWKLPTRKIIRTIIVVL